jgi:hypothetical protein
MLSKKAAAVLTCGIMLAGVSACSPPVKEVTPQVCIDALDHSGEMVGLVADWIAMDTKLIHNQMSTDAALANMDDLKPKIKAATDAWMAASEECRSKQ